MGIWTIWLLMTIAVIAAKYYTARTKKEMKLRLIKREEHLSSARLENKVIRSNHDVAKRHLSVAQKRVAELKELIENQKQELKGLQELEQREMQVAKDLIEKIKEHGG